MTIDWATLNARAAAVPGGIPWRPGMLDAGGLRICMMFRRGGIGAIYPAALGRERTGRPDLSDSATRGALWDALGMPSVLINRSTGYTCALGRRPMDAWERLSTARGLSRDYAFAAALVALAEARGGWTDARRVEQP